MTAHHIIILDTIHHHWDYNKCNEFCHDGQLGVAYSMIVASIVPHALVVNGKDMIIIENSKIIDEHKKVNSFS